MGKIFIIFSSLAILIACLGLFALTAYAAEQRNREISIRKVLGASESSIVFLLSRKFVKLIGVSICIAIPLSWWIMNKWLQQFAYKESPPLWIFVVGIVCTLLIAFVTISIQILRAASLNPVTNLKAE